MSSPPPDHVIPSTEPASKPCGAKLILQEVIRKHFEGFTACPLTSPHRFNTLAVLGKFAKIWHRPYLNRANNLCYVLDHLSNHILYAEGPLSVSKSLPTRLFIRFHNDWTDLKFVNDMRVIDHYDYKTNKIYHAALDFGDVTVKSINLDVLRKRLVTARFSTEQLVPGQVYHLVYAVVTSTHLKFLGDLQTAYLGEIPDDVFVTQYTQLHSLRDIVCRGVGVVQTECPIAFKACDFVLDSKGRMTLLEDWDRSPLGAGEDLLNSPLLSSLDPARLIQTDSVVGSSYVKECLHGLYPILKSSLTDKSAIPRAVRLLKLVSGVTQALKFPRSRLTCRACEVQMLNKCGYVIRACADISEVAVQPVDSDCLERSRLFGRTLSWASLLPPSVFRSLVNELSYEVPQSNTDRKSEVGEEKKKVRLTSSLLVSDV